jgi:hypothetical protein
MVKRYCVGLVTPAGTLTGWRRSYNLLNRHMIAIFTCSKCNREKAESRMDAFLDRDTSCGCMGKTNRARLIDKIIRPYSLLNESPRESR